MFQNWGFLLAEIWVLLILAALIGLFAGWLIWARREAQTLDLSPGIAEYEHRITGLQTTINDQKSQIVSLSDDLAACRASHGTVADSITPTAKPATLTEPRRGTPDDLKRIKGIGPQLEQLCHKLGFYHFDQIAGWTPAEVAWVDQNLTGFTGRVTRDNWIEQAQLLASGEQTDFSRKVDKGDVY